MRSTTVSTTPFVIGFAVAMLLTAGLVIWLVYDDDRRTRGRTPLRSGSMRWDVRDKNADKARGRIEAKLDEIIDLLGHILFQLTTRTDQGEEIVADLAALQAEVAQNTDVTASAVATINGIAQQLRDALAANDPAAIQAVVDQLDSNSAALAAAITENTPHVDHTLPGDLPQ